MKPIFLIRGWEKISKDPQLPVNIVLISSILVVLLSMPAYAQIPFEETAPGKYRIELTDKDKSPYSLNAPGDFLSEKALVRRQKQNISLTWNDLPVTPSYVDSIRATGATVLTVSKWFNAVTVSAADDSILHKILKLSFVRKVPVKRTGPPGSSANRIAEGIQETSRVEAFDYGPSGWQSIIHKGEILHSEGYTGLGKTIAIIDAGFYHVDQLEAFASLREKGQILGTHDFVQPGSNLFAGHSHGMVVLSVIGGNLPGELIGTAPDASFWLLRSEDTGSEYLIEEDNWTAAAEFADSAGADVISSSLGYSRFDDPLMNHTYGDMDGNTTRISRSADIAVSKGMVVVVSAGNQGTNDWHFISAPADADSVIAVGAIDANGYIADFSSRGPSSDLRVKPDVVAIGKGTWMADFVSGIRQGNGTSLSTPVISGLVACLWQAVPDAPAMDVVASIKESSDRFTRPDEDYGYGIPDFNLAHVLLRSREYGVPGNNQVMTFPNPFNTLLYIIFSSPVDGPADVSLVDISGRVVLHLVYPQFTGRNYITLDQGLSDLNKGIYFLKVVTGGKISISQLIKR